jgi:hypothetical protein
MRGENTITRRHVSSSCPLTKLMMNMYATVLSTADMQSVLAAQDRTIIRETQFTFYMN